MYIVSYIISYISICFELLLRCYHQEDVILSASGFQLIKNMDYAMYN